MAKIEVGRRMQIIPKAGHLPNLDNPAFFNRIVEEFILSVDRRLP